MPRTTTKPLFSIEKYLELPTLKAKRDYKKATRLKPSCYSQMIENYPIGQYHNNRCMKWVLITPVEDSLDLINRLYNNPIMPERYRADVLLYHSDDTCHTYILSFKVRKYGSSFRWMDARWSWIPHHKFFE